MIARILRKMIRPTWKFNAGEHLYYKGVYCKVDRTYYIGNVHHTQATPVNPNILVSVGFESEYSWKTRLIRVT